MATTSPFASTGNTWSTQRTKAAPNSSGSIAAKTRPKVSCEGMPCSSFRYCRNHPSFSFAQASISTKVSAPDRTALTETTSNSIRSCSTFVVCLGSRTPTQTSTNRNLLSAPHGKPQKDRKLHKSGGCEQPLGNSLSVNDYFGGVNDVGIHAIALHSWLL
jgi:hypothetical protein